MMPIHRPQNHLPPVEAASSAVHRDPVSSHGLYALPATRREYEKAGESVRESRVAELLEPAT